MDYIFLYVFSYRWMVYFKLLLKEQNQTLQVSIWEHLSSAP